jgi:hypothetical protein
MLQRCKPALLPRAGVERKLALLHSVDLKKMIVNPNELHLGSRPRPDAFHHFLHRKRFGRTGDVVNAHNILLKAVDNPIRHVAHIDKLNRVRGSAGNNHHASQRGPHRPIQKSARSIARADHETGPKVGDAAGHGLFGGFLAQRLAAAIVGEILPISSVVGSASVLKGRFHRSSAC